MASITEASGYGRYQPQRGFKPPAPRVARTDHSALRQLTGIREQRRRDEQFRQQREGVRKANAMAKLTAAGSMPKPFEDKYKEAYDNAITISEDSSASIQDIQNAVFEAERIRKIGEAEQNMTNEIYKGVARGTTYTTNAFNEGYDASTAHDMSINELANSYTNFLRNNSGIAINPNETATTAQAFLDAKMESDQDIQRIGTIGNGAYRWRKSRHSGIKGEVGERMPEETRLFFSSMLDGTQGAARQYMAKAKDMGVIGEDAQYNTAVELFADEMIPKLNFSKSTVGTGREFVEKTKTDKTPDYLPPESRTDEISDEYSVTQVNAVDIPRGMKITIDTNGVSTGGEVSKIRYDENGNEVAEITYSINTGGVDDRSGKPKTQLKTQILPLEDVVNSIKSTGTKKQYDALTERVNKLREVGDTQTTVYDWDKMMDKSTNIRGGQEGSKIIVESMNALDIVPENVDYDPTGEDDLAFTFNGKRYSYNFDKISDRDRFKKDKDSFQGKSSNKYGI